MQSKYITCIYSILTAKMKTRKDPSVRKRMDRLAKAPLSPVSKPRHINSIFTTNTPIFRTNVIELYFPMLC